RPSTPSTSTFLSPPPPRPPLSPLFPYTTLFRSPFRQQRVHVLHAGFDGRDRVALERRVERRVHAEVLAQQFVLGVFVEQVVFHQDRKSTRLNSSHVAISYAVFCLKKKKITVSIV